MSVSSDKSIIIHDSTTLEPIQKIEKSHKKGVIDAVWLDNDNILTCSTDNTLKCWNIIDGKETKYFIFLYLFR